jgi:hypothetical protein
MAWSKLALYNVACLALGEGPLDGLTDDTELRRQLDSVYSRGDGAIAYFMENGHWNFAMRAVKIDNDSAVTPAFGWTYAFSKPTDFRKLNMISSDEEFITGLNAYEDEADHWHADIDPIYVRYVSDDADYGGDFAKWTETFAIWAGHWMALQVAPVKMNDTALKDFRKLVRRLLTEARSNDAVGEPTRFPKLSSWASARHSSKQGRRDRGSRNSLLG